MSDLARPTFLLMSDIICRFCLTCLWTKINMEVPISNFNFVLQIFKEGFFSYLPIPDKKGFLFYK